MTWVIEAVVVGVLCYLMVDGYRAIKERKRLERERFDEEVRRVLERGR
jgi:hypothetical protein